MYSISISSSKPHWLTVVFERTASSRKTYVATISSQDMLESSFSLNEHVNILYEIPYTAHILAIHPGNSEGKCASEKLEKSVIEKLNVMAVPDQLDTWCPGCIYIGVSNISPLSESTGTSRIPASVKNTDTNLSQCTKRVH